MSEWPKDRNLLPPSCECVALWEIVDRLSNGPSRENQFSCLKSGNSSPFVSWMRPIENGQSGFLMDTQGKKQFACFDPFRSGSNVGRDCRPLVLFPRVTFMTPLDLYCYDNTAVCHYLRYKLGVTRHPASRISFPSCSLGPV